MDKTPTILLISGLVLALIGGLLRALDRALNRRGKPVPPGPPSPIVLPGFMQLLFIWGGLALAAVGGVLALAR